MSDRDVVLEELERDAETYERKGDLYGEDYGAPYREAAAALREIVADRRGDA